MKNTDDNNNNIELSDKIREKNSINQNTTKKPNLNNITDEEYEIERKKLLELVENNKSNLKKIAASLPDRNLISMEDMSLCMKNKSHNLSEIEKVYMLFYWFHLNIAYDADGYFKAEGISQPDLAYKYGKGICSGYSKLYIYLGKAIGINVDSISGYAKGYRWNKDNEPNINHQWNYIIIKNVYYLFDVTGGSGCFKNNKYEKRLDEIRFLPSPRNYLFTHLSSDSKF